MFYFLLGINPVIENSLLNFLSISRYPL